MTVSLWCVHTATTGFSSQTIDAASLHNHAWLYLPNHEDDEGGLAVPFTSELMCNTQLVSSNRKLSSTSDKAFSTVSDGAWHFLLGERSMTGNQRQGWFQSTHSTLHALQKGDAIWLKLPSTAGHCRQCSLPDVQIASWQTKVHRLLLLPKCCCFHGLAGVLGISLSTPVIACSGRLLFSGFSYN